jgi:hypothetical protein
MPDIYSDKTGTGICLREILTLAVNFPMLICGYRRVKPSQAETLI